MPTRPPTLRIARPRAARVHYTQHKATGLSRRGARTLKLNSAAWARLRQAVYREKGRCCVMCAEIGRYRFGSHIDHKDGDATNNDLANLQPLCPSHHSSKTNREDGGFGNRRRT